MSETKRPVVFDVNCPFDHEIECHGVLVVGDKSRATHEALHVKVGPRGEVLGIATKPIEQRFDVPVKPLLPETYAEKFTREKAKAAKRIAFASEYTGTWLPAQRPDGNPTRLRYLKPALPADFPDLSGVPKPDFDWDAEMQAALNEANRSVCPKAPEPVTRTEALRAHWVGPPKSNAQINYEMRERGQRNKERGILKHGPFGSGGAGPCDPDCAKCAAQRENAGHFTVRYMVRAPNGEMQDVSKEEYDRASAAASAKSSRADRLFLAAQREDGQAVLAISLQEIEEASRRWAAQLRLKVEESKRRDAEAARYTPYWSPEEQSGGDL